MEKNKLMTKLNTKLLLILCLIFTFSSCNDAYEENDKKKNIHLSFVLSLGDNNGTADNSSKTRSTQSRIIGKDYEGQIDANDFYVAIYDASNNYITQLQGINIYYTGKKDLYEFIGNTDLPETKLNSTCKIMVFANCGEINKDTNINQLTFNYSKNGYNINSQTRHLIPMWGVKTIENFNIKKGERLELGKINLLRAMAKVEVSLDSTVDNFTLKSVSLNNCYNMGSILPLNYENTLELADDYTVGNARIPSKTTLGTLSSVPFNKKDNNNFVIYIPEFNNINKPVGGIK